MCEPLRLARPTELELDGYGWVVVTPGGEDLDVRKDALMTAQAAFAAALAALGVGSLDEAEAALDRRHEAESDLSRCEVEIRAMLQASAVATIEELAQQRADHEAEMAVIRDRLGAPGDEAEPAELEVRADARAADLTRARQALDKARLAVADANHRLAAADSAAAGIRGEQLAAAARVAELQERLAVERAQQTDETLVSASSRPPNTISPPSRHTTASPASCRPVMRTACASGWRIAERELAALEAERRRLDGEIRDLEVALREAGADSWVERLGEIEGALAGAREMHRRLELEGQAWRLLADRLAAADQSVREALVAPIGLRLQPLLQRVFPGAEPVLDPERLSLTHLRRERRRGGLRQPERRHARAARRPGPPGLRPAPGRARGRGALPDPRRCPGLRRRGPVRDHEGHPAAGRPRAADPGAHLPPARLFRARRPLPAARGLSRDLGSARAIPPGPDRPPASWCAPHDEAERTTA